MDEPTNYALEAALWVKGLSPHQNKGSPPPAKTAPSCRMGDGRCGICGGDWSVCGCQGMLNRSVAAKDQSHD